MIARRGMCSAACVLRLLLVGAPVTLLPIVLLTAPPTQAQTTRSASLQGVIVSADSREPIVGATLTVAGNSVTTDSSGKFSFTQLPAGSLVMNIAATGYQIVQKTLQLTAGANTLPTIPLQTTALQLSDVNVNDTASAALNKFDDKSSTDTLTESLSDTALKNSNAQNVSDFMKDVSGVAVSKGANGSSSVSVRGIDQRMLRITVDGQRQGGSGNPLDNIPPEIVQSLEVTKTFTPDMEADAVGGVINVNTGGLIINDAYIQGRDQASYNTLAPRPGLRNSITLGQPFALFTDKPNASVLATVSFDDQYSRRERLSTLREWTPQLSPGPAPYTGTLVPVLTLPLIEATSEHRQRSGLVLNSDARFDDLVVFWRSNLSRDWAHRNRNYNDTNPADGAPLSLTPSVGIFTGVPLSRRNQEQISKREALNLSFGAKYKMNNTDLDANFAYGLTDENEPRTLETGFISDHHFKLSYDLGPNAYAPAFTYVDETSPGDTRSASDPTHYQLDYLNLTHTDVTEQDGSAKINLKIALQNGIDYLKFGLKAQQRHRLANTDRDIYNAGLSGLNMSGLVGSDQVSLNTLNYQFGPVPSANALAQLLTTNPAVFQANTIQSAINSTTGDSSVTETLWALYGMGKFAFKQWTVLGGVRVEGTRVHSFGNQMSLDGSGLLQGFNPARAINNYVEILPGLHLRYEPKSGLLYRGSITRSMSRPSNADIAPFRTLSFIDHRSRIGAPDLKPYLSTNFDISLDWYDSAYGLASVALFFKKIDHFITDAQYPVTIGNLGEFIEFKRVNGEAARAMGGELSWQGPTWALPLKLGRGSLEANYNYNHGEAHHPTRPGETLPLPRQVDHQASVKFHDARGPLSMDASISYRTGWWEDLIAAGFDNYINSAWDAEVSGAYKIGKNTRITAGISNLFNRPTRHYAGIPTRMNDWQRNGIDMNLGIQWKM
jgi:TonB-dependent receptor